MRITGRNETRRYTPVNMYKSAAHDGGRKEAVMAAKMEQTVAEPDPARVGNRSPWLKSFRMGRMLLLC